LIVRTRGAGWPTEPVTAAVDFVDLVWHELEFRDGYSFTYAVYDTGGNYLGCCYLYPLGRRTELSEALIDYDVDVSWWVTRAAYERGDYDKLYTALRHWLATEFSFCARTTRTGKSLVELPKHRLIARRSGPLARRDAGARAVTKAGPGTDFRQLGALWDQMRCGSQPGGSSQREYPLFRYGRRRGTCVA
jgi:hypothetical protein